jgi:hypothetical protein
LYAEASHFAAQAYGEVAVIFYSYNFARGRPAIHQKLVWLPVAV